MANTHTAAIIVLTAGGLTWTNEWLQNPDPSQISWRVPVAALIGAGLIDMVAKLDNGAAIALSVMILIGAAVTPFHGNSVADEIGKNLLAASSKPKKGTKKKGK